MLTNYNKLCHARPYIITQVVRSVFQAQTFNKAGYDIIVVGGGIIGMAAARELLLRYNNLKMAVVEKEDHLAVHQSGHNSGVIHGGIYYTPGSLKARLCVEGLKLMYEYCDLNNIHYKKVGKLIVATDKGEIKKLQELYDRALQNGVADVKLIDGSEIKTYEPYCEGVQAIWSPHTGIVDYTNVVESYGKDFKNMGGRIFNQFKVNGFSIVHETDEGMNEYPIKIISNNKSLNCKYVLTCGGLFSDELASMAGCRGDDPRIVPFRGEYLILKPEKSYLVRGNIYPVPDIRLPFLGVHFTPKINGDVLLGPNAVFAFKREGYSWFDFEIKDTVQSLMHRGFQRLALQHFAFGVGEVTRSFFPHLQVLKLKKYIPSLTADDIIRGPTGVRAQAINRDGSLVDDFVFNRDTSTEIGSRVLHCRNVPSPGATSSLAIAKLVADKCLTEFNL